jgi:prepilin-type N-terminal cleavage/methylation domain-containing protein
MKTRKQTGFTLVEIAIVLVVIGLLLGGILKGQQLINSARVRNLADQNSGVQAAYYGFIDRFRNLPGDMTPQNACTQVGQNIDALACATPANAPGGDGNGRIDTIAEAGAVWPHLSVAGFLNGTFSGQDSSNADLTSATYLTGVSLGAVPPNAFQGPILLAHMNDYMQGNVGATIVRLSYSFGGLIPVPILRDLDAKLDDGVAGTGVLRSSIKSGDANASGVFDGAVAWTDGASAAEDCVDEAATNSTWRVDSSNQTCNAVFLY